MSNAPNPTPAAVVPVKCISILLCEAAYLVANTTNLIVVNTFNRLSASAFPCHFPRITVLYTVTDGHGTYELEVAVVNAATGQVSMEMSQRSVLTDPLSIMDVQVTMLHVPLPAPGKYWMEVRCDGSLIGQRPFYVYGP
jgi:hypothetical protein